MGILWSLMTALTALPSTVLGFALVRVGLGVAEGGAFPASAPSAVAIAAESSGGNAFGKRERSGSRAVRLIIRILRSLGKLRGVRILDWRGRAAHNPGHIYSYEYAAGRSP